MTVVIKGLRKEDVIGLRATFRENVTILPAEHGRLIDGDELESMCGEPYWGVSLGKIENAPTIIEAEEGEVSE